MRQRKQSLFSIAFVDGSSFTLPQAWEKVFLADFGTDPTTYPHLAERVRFVVEKYMAHRAWPTKFDGLLHGAVDDDRRYDDPDFYFEHWDEWQETGKRGAHAPSPIRQPGRMWLRQSCISSSAQV